MNARMPELKRCFEAAGFSEVKTVLSSGNVVFDARAASLESLARRAQDAMARELERGFGTFVRPVSHLQGLLASDPFRGFDVPAQAKLIVTFLRQAPAQAVALPIQCDGASILAVREAEALACYVPGPRGPVFMRLLERTFGSDITTRTIDTVRKCAAA
jgi:uncharacterized protein (DUF1697 family)